MDSTFWRKKKVLVTGHTGFVGAWLCAVLNYFDVDAVGFSLEEEPGSLYERIKTNLNTTCIYGDLRDENAVRQCVDRVKPDVVFHIAAYGFVKECFDDPQRAYTSNVQGTLNLFQILRETEFGGRIIVASSDKVYKNSGKDAYLFRENDPLGGIDPYSASKTCEDLVAQSCYDSYLSSTGSSLCIVRPSNILGGGDHNINRLIPSIYHNLSDGKRPEIRNPDAIRPWQNILDMVDAYLTITETADGGAKIFNVGPEPDGIKTVGEIADYVSGLYGQMVDVRDDASITVKEKAYLGLSIDKIKTEIGWKPKRSLEETLREIYDYYINDDGSNTYNLCMEQIQDYYKS